MRFCFCLLVGMLAWSARELYVPPDPALQQCRVQLEERKAQEALVKQLAWTAADLGEKAHKHGAVCALLYEEVESARNDCEEASAVPVRHDGRARAVRAKPVPDRPDPAGGRGDRADAGVLRVPEAVPGHEVQVTAGDPGDSGR